MDLVRAAIRQPVSVAVGVVLVLLAGLLALGRIPIQLTPNVEDTIVAVTTLWEGASPQEVEQDVVDPQEEKLQGITGLERITSTSQQGQGQVRLEFAVGTPKDLALREVSDKLREVPRYPETVDEPVVDASDPENRDYIAWFVFDCTDPAVDVRELQDFAEDRIKPVLERVSGVSEINVLGGRERETQVRFDPVALARVGISVDRLARALRQTNENFSAGALDESRSEVRVRLVSQYESVEQVLDTLVAETPGGSIRVRDVAEVVETFKEPTGFVRSRGRPVIAINAQREVGANVMEVMEGLRGAVARVNAGGGLLEAYGTQLGLDGKLVLEQVYDQTVYIDDALALVRNNIWIGGALAVVVLLLFLRSVRSSAIVTLSIPISVVGAVVFLVVLGRSVNVISLAGMAFAVGMVVDNAIVVLENVFRHLEMGKSPARAAYEGAREVFGAVVAATLTTVVVFVPILLIEEEAGQLFRDIALAIVAAVALSLAVSVTVIPCASARMLKPMRQEPGAGGPRRHRFADAVAGLVHRLCGSVPARVSVVLLLTAASLFGTWALLPPADYLPTGNRNLAFGLIVPPPGMSVEQQETLGLRIEEGMRPYFEAGTLEPGSEAFERAAAALPTVPTFDFETMSPGPAVRPPPLENYFLVAFPGAMFHGGIAAVAERVPDVLPLFQHVTSAGVLPGVLAFAFQVPLFQLGGRSGSAVEIDFSGDDLARVTRAAGAAYGTLVQRYGPFTLQPNPSNFDLPTPELQVLPQLERLGELGMTPSELGVAVQALGDGAFVGDYVIGSQTIDLKLVAKDSLGEAPLADLADRPLAAPDGEVVPLGALAELRRVNAPGQINRIGRQRSVSLQFTPPPGMPLGEAIESIEEVLGSLRSAGAIPFDVETGYSGSASKLDAVSDAMLGDGTLAGTLSSSLALALLVVYLLMCVLFQSFLTPLIILFSVPLATLGGFAALYGVHVWSLSDRYMPVQNLDVLTMLGFVILIGIVVNNAILIVHQTGHFLRGSSEEGRGPLAPREAIAEAVRSRVRPIFMSTLTSVLGMSPLIFMPGAGSELYRGLGSVVVGGLLVSTVFTLLLVPLLFSLVLDAQARLGFVRRGEDELAAPAGGPARAGAALGLLLCVGLTMLGCAAPPPPRSARTSAAELARVVLQDELARLAEAERAAAPEEPPSAVEELVGQRREELEELGGPRAWRDAEVELGPDLVGREQSVRALSLTDALARALTANLELRVVRLESGIEEAGVTRADAAFDTVVFATAEGETATVPGRVPIINGVTIGTPSSEEERVLGEVGARRLLESGASVSVSGFLEGLNDETRGIAFDPDPAWSSGVSLALTQPLLQGYGRTVTTAERAFARRAAEAAREDVGTQALALVAAVESLYWDLAQAWDALRVRRHVADQGIAVERVLRERLAFDADQAAWSDALATVERRRRELVLARRAVRAASDALKGALDDPLLGPSGETLLAPGDLPPPPAEGLGLAQCIAEALEARPELRRSLLAIEDADLRRQVAADLRRARLDLVAQVSWVGLDGDVDDSFRGIARDDDLTALLGLSFERPVGLRAGRAVQRQEELRARQAVARHAALIRDVILEVKAALRDVETSASLVEAARSTRLAETENLRAILVEEETRSRLTPEFLALKLVRQDRVASAQLAEVEAQAEHRRALARLRRATGSGARDQASLAPGE